MKLPSTRTPTTRERLEAEYQEWEDNGRQTVPTARLLAGMYAVLYRRRYHMRPISPVQDDLESFDAMLRLLREDPSVAPYCIEALFALKEFNVKASAFANSNVLDRWNVVERANKLRRRNANGGGEQAEYRSDVRGYGVIRV